MRLACFLVTLHVHTEKGPFRPFFAFQAPADSLRSSLRVERQHGAASRANECQAQRALAHTHALLDLAHARKQATQAEGVKKKTPHTPAAQAPIDQAQ